MTTEFGAELIQAYLHARGVRYFRGHHDDEFFFFVNAYHGRLHVHLQACGRDDAAVKITVTAERYYPAAARAAVESLADRWNRSAPAASAVVFESCDPRLLGVVAKSRYARGEFGAVVDRAVQSAIDLFGRLRAVAPARQDGERLLDAG